MLAVRSAIQKLLLSAAGLMVLLVVSMSSAAADADSVQHNPTIHVGFVPAKGYIDVDMHGNISGMVYDYMQMLANYAGVRMAFSPCTTTRCQIMLQNDDLDVLLNVIKGEGSSALNYSSQGVSKALIYLALNDDAAERGNEDQPYSIGFNYQQIDRDRIAEAFERMGWEEGEHYVLLPYLESADMLDEFDSKVTDGIILDSSQSINKDISVSSVLSQIDTYFAVKSGDSKKDLLAKLDHAADKLLMDYPMYRESLYNRYLNSQPLLLSPAELRYIEQHPDLTVFSMPNDAPFSYFENGEHKGAIHEIMEQLASKLGLSLTFQETSGYSEILQQFGRGEGDIISDFYANFSFARLNDVKITIPYMSINYVRMFRRNEEIPTQPIIACPDDQYMTKESIQKLHPEGQVVFYDDTRACLRAVLEGTADLAYVKTFSLKDFQEDEEFRALTTDGNVALIVPVSIAMHNNVDPIFVGILNKALVHLNNLELISAINRSNYLEHEIEAGFSFTPYINQFKNFYENNRTNTYYIIAGCAGALLLLFLLCLLRHIIAKRKVWRLTYIDAATGLYYPRWFDRYLPDRIEKIKKADAKGAARQRKVRDKLIKVTKGKQNSADLQALPPEPQSAMFIMALSIRQITVLRETYKIKALAIAMMNLIREARKRFPWIKEVATTSAYTTIYAFCHTNDGRTPFDLVDDLVQGITHAKIGRSTVRLDYHVGICEIPREGHYTVRTIIDDAMLAHNSAEVRDQTIEVFSKEKRELLVKQRRMIDLMDKALKSGEFKIWLQPKYDITTHQIIGAEALVRWDSPELGFVMPKEFIELFEKNSSVFNLDYYMLEGVCRLQKERIDKGLPVLPIAVNQSGMHISEKGYLKHMREIAERYSLPSGCVELEITETAFIDFTTKQARQHTGKVIEGLQELKFELSMDDFCTGYSSIALLQNVNMSTMKIDRSLVETAMTTARAEKILHNVIIFGNALNMKVICEGVETPEQEQMLLRLGCRYAQGFLYAKPMPLDEFSNFAYKGLKPAAAPQHMLSAAQQNPATAKAPQAKPAAAPQPAAAKPAVPAAKAARPAAAATAKPAVRTIRPAAAQPQVKPATAQPQAKPAAGARPAAPAAGVSAAPGTARPAPRAATGTAARPAVRPQTPAAQAQARPAAKAVRTAPAQAARPAAAPQAQAQPQQ